MKVGRLLSIVYVQKEYLALGAGLFNLFQMATPEEFTTQKPDAVLFFGLDEALFEDDEKRGFVTKEDEVYYGLIPDHPQIDYFGYMKKMMLTLHNIIQIEKKAMPVHGAFAKIRVSGKKSANVLLIGDSGAGKSETLEAINKLPKDLACDFDILIDDMGSLHFNKEGELMAVGTEIGAFVRLDDLQPGYAYSTMDRSIFMNPNIVNARVIVPQMSYEEISKSTRVDFVFYINNYEKIDENAPAIELFDDLEVAYGVFSEGKRMAKGTTGEVGITTTYFANPFGAVQLKEKHEKIAKKTFSKMTDNGVRIGMIRTQLGIPGFEQEGPFVAARSLIHFIDQLNK
jgi:energy-coupling factor transporter ATP-binding protein EcfA2